MTVSRRISIELHAGVELLLGIALIATPFAIGLGPAAILTGVAVGVTLVGLALGAIDTGGKRTLPLSAHASYDWTLGVALVAAAALFGVAGSLAALAAFLVAGLTQLALTGMTRYSAARG